MPPLPSPLRNTLEQAVIKGHDAAEAAARAAVAALAVQRPEPFATMSPEDRRLRNGLRAAARQLAGGDLTAGIEPLVEEIAYEQWHRMLFARFLAENGLLMHPGGAAVTLQDCADLAAEEGVEDGWVLAATYAGVMLPGIFRGDDPAVRVRFAPEGRYKLEVIIGELPAAVFTADDAIGWVYQFWQTNRKKEINASGKKIGAEELAPVTQLFTEHYMVRFLLENSLGAWWAARHPDSPLLKQYDYLRFRDDGTPAAGTFSGWPARAAEVTMMDPCCGSGHFLVAAFEMLRRMRMEEGLSEVEAADAVLRDNLFGLELDPRCTQIAAFALALAAWKVGGYRELPVPNIACSGIGVGGRVDEWTSLAGDDVRLQTTLERLYYLFRDAPTLGSLINPANVPMNERLFSADYAQVEPLLRQALAKERTQSDPTAEVFGAAAQGIARAAKLLSSTYTIVATNVPFLSRSKQDLILMKFSDAYYPNSKRDLATVFVERCRSLTEGKGAFAIVTPQNWRFLGSYSQLRKALLKELTWNFIINLGPQAFQTPMWDFNVGLSILTDQRPSTHHPMAAMDVAVVKGAGSKASRLIDKPLEFINQLGQLDNPDARIVLGESTSKVLLGAYASALQGISPADLSHYGRLFWEVEPSSEWQYWQGRPDSTIWYGGRSKVLWWSNGLMEAVESGKAYIRGQAGWNKLGIAVAQMGELPCTLYTGDKADTNVAVIVPKDPAHRSAIWAFCSSPDYNKAVRQINQKLNVDVGYLTDVPFDLGYWQAVADATDPLPKPHSDDPTQWIVTGHPVGSTEPLQVAVARLLGYRCIVDP